MLMITPQEKNKAHKGMERVRGLYFKIVARGGLTWRVTAESRPKGRKRRSHEDFYGREQHGQRP